MAVRSVRSSDLEIEEILQGKRYEENKLEL